MSEKDKPVLKQQTPSRSKISRAVNHLQRYGLQSFLKKTGTKLRETFFPTPIVPIVQTDMLSYQTQIAYSLDKPLQGSFYFPLAGLSRFEVLTATYKKEPGDIELILKEKTRGKIARRVRLKGNQIKDGDYSIFTFRPIRRSANKEYQFGLQSLREPYPAVWLNPDVSFPDVRLEPDAQGSINCRIYSSARIDEIYELWIKKNEPRAEELERQRKTRFKYEPKISLIVPTFRTPKRFLIEMVESVLAQTYGNWELCIADGGSGEAYIGKTLQDFMKKDPRVKVRYLTENKGIAGNSNEALSLASGDYVALLDHDDVIPPFALHEVVKKINEQPETEFIYTDRDNISEDSSRRSNPFFKPEFSPYYLLSTNYLAHFCLLKKNLIDRVKGFRQGFDGSQDYDLFLRATELTEKIVHIPKILYHWRKSAYSAAGSHEAKPYAYQAALRAISEAMERRGIRGEVSMIPDIYGLYQIRLKAEKKSKVSIVIPTKDNHQLISRCVDSIVSQTTHGDFEIVIVDNASAEPKVLEYYEELRRVHPKVRVVPYNEPFNFQKAINLGARASKGEFLVFLNNDIEVITEDWLEQFQAWCSLDDVAIVSGKLLFKDNTIQHAGLLVGVKGYVGVSHRDLSKDEPGYGGMIQAVKEYSAVAAACMMVKKKCFELVKGFDESFQIAHGDIDFCLKLRQKGYKILYIPTVELYHYESRTRGYEDTLEKIARFTKENSLLMSRWRDILLKGDPYYNPNLNREKGDFSIKI